VTVVQILVCCVIEVTSANVLLAPRAVPTTSINASTARRLI
jgi:hypothetical protein